MKNPAATPQGKAKSASAKPHGKMPATPAKGKEKPVGHAKVDGPAPGSDEHYKAREAMHTLMRAAEIKADPKLHGHAKAMAMEEAGRLKKIARKNG